MVKVFGRIHALISRGYKPQNIKCIFNAFIKDHIFLPFYKVKNKNEFRNLSDQLISAI